MISDQQTVLDSKGASMNNATLGNRQQGISIISLVLLLALLGTLAIVSFRFIPLYADYFTVVKIAQDMQAEGSVLNKPKREIRNMLNKRFRTNNLWDLKAEETIKIKKDPARGVLLHIDYEVRSPLIYNLEVVAKFDKVVSRIN